MKTGRKVLLIESAWNDAKCVRTIQKSSKVLICVSYAMCPSIRGCSPSRSNRQIFCRYEDVLVIRRQPTIKYRNEVKSNGRYVCFTSLTSRIYEGGTSCWQFGAWCGSTKYRITSQYIERTSGFSPPFHRVGICCVKISNLQLIRVNDIAFSETCCCDGCSKITILSKDPSDPVMEIVGIDNARQVYDRIRDVVNGMTTNAKVELRV